MLMLAVCCLLVPLALGADSGCTNRGGTCQTDSLACSGHYQSSLCSGASNRRCCLDADSHCTSQGGHCSTSSTCPAGHYVSGLCSGPSNRRCCEPGSGSGSSSVQLPGCPQIVTRSEWGARAPKHSSGTMPSLPIYVFIHHGDGSECYDKASCMAKVRGYQNYHMDGHGWSDIGYNFVVGEDGNAYEARGWTRVGAHTQGYNSNGIAICIIGDFNSKLPNSAALNTVKQLIQCGLDNHRISPSYTLKGHRDVGNTDCPGTTLYNLIHSWPHYVAAHGLYHG